MQKHVIAITNQKGGVGKTTSCVNIAACLGNLGYRVLLIDVDPQGNATTACGFKQRTLNKSVMNWFEIGSDAYLQTIEQNDEHGFDVVGADYRLATIFRQDHHSADYHILSEKINQIIHNYDCVLIDCPPAFGYLTWSALAAATGVLVPMQCEYYPLEGLSTIVATVKKFQESINPSLKIIGIIRTMFDRRNRLSNEVSEQLIEHFGHLVFQTMIPRNVRLAEAPSHGKTAIDYDVKSNGSMAYIALTLEFIRKIRLTKFNQLERSCRAQLMT